MDTKIDLKAIALILEKSHVMVWTNLEEDDAGIIITSRDDAERISELIDEKEPESFTKVVALLKKAKIPLAAKSWDEDDEDGFSYFEFPYCDDDEDEDDDDDDDDNDDEDDEIEFEDSDIKQEYLLSMDGCPECEVWKKKYRKEILSKEIIVVDVEKGKGKTIADSLEIDEVPMLVAELIPRAVKKYDLDGPYHILEE